MKTYESERKELHDWIDMKNKEHSEAMRKDTTRGHDSPLDYERRQVVKEYNRKLMELKQKYGKENPENKSTATGRTFGDSVVPPHV